MNKTFRILIMLTLIFVGVILGGILGFYGLFWICQYLDGQEAERAASGGGYVAVGWIFLFVTIPFGSLIGGITGFFGYKILKVKFLKAT
ncbi:hypothetical protein D1013_08400 [Euzebyella marina]|uniref:Uncharacterized protein n=1 Tax=Euzebyella marina TaxID=1761453 RepID=A0A3G2L550_9FLAO|nr:hypothetical protein [Euzebyella marina]AYN67384.1 hypothetical protein D1013_08400 [Euzebyella marina]